MYVILVSGTALSDQTRIAADKVDEPKVLGILRLNIASLIFGFGWEYAGIREYDLITRRRGRGTKVSYFSE